MKKLFFLLALFLLFSSIQAATLDSCILSPSTLETGKDFTFSASFALSAAGGVKLPFTNTRLFSEPLPSVKLYVTQPGKRNAVLYESGGQQVASQTWDWSSGSSASYRDSVTRTGDILKQYGLAGGACTFVCEINGVGTRKPCTIVDRVESAKAAVQQLRTPPKTAPAGSKPSASAGASPAKKPAAPSTSAKGFTVAGLTVNGVSADASGVSSSEVIHRVGYKTSATVRVSGPSDVQLRLQLVAVNKKTDEIKELGSRKFFTTKPEYFSFTNIPDGSYTVSAIVSDAKGEVVASKSWTGTLTVTTKGFASKEGGKFDFTKLRTATRFKDSYSSVVEFCKAFVETAIKDGQIKTGQQIYSITASMTSDATGGTKVSTQTAKLQELKVLAADCVAQFSSASKFGIGEKGTFSFARDRLERINDNLLAAIGSGQHANLIVGGGQGFSNSELNQNSDLLAGYDLLDNCIAQGMTLTDICNQPTTCLDRFKSSDRVGGVQRLTRVCQEATVRVAMRVDERQDASGDPRMNIDRLREIHRIVFQELLPNNEYERAYRASFEAFQYFPSVSPLDRASIESVGDPVARKLLADLFDSRGRMIQNNVLGDANSCVAGLQSCLAGLGTVQNIEIIGGMVALSFTPAVVKNVGHLGAGLYFGVTMSMQAIEESKSGKSNSKTICQTACTGTMAAAASFGAVKSAAAVRGATGVKVDAEAQFQKGQKLELKYGGRPVGQATLLQRLNPFDRWARNIIEKADPNTALGRGIESARQQRQGRAAPEEYDAASGKTKTELQQRVKQVPDRVTQEIDGVKEGVEAAKSDATTTSQRIRSLKEQRGKATKARQAEIDAEIASLRPTLRQHYTQLLSQVAKLKALRENLRQQYLKPKATTAGGKALKSESSAAIQEQIGRLDKEIARLEKEAQGLFDRDLLVVEPKFKSQQEALDYAKELERQAQEKIQEAERLEQEATPRGEPELAGSDTLARIERDIGDLKNRVEEFRRLAEERRSDATRFEARAKQYDADGSPKQAKLQRDFRDASETKAKEYDSAAREAERDVSGLQEEASRLRSKPEAVTEVDVDATRTAEISRLENDIGDLRVRAEEFKQKAEDARFDAQRFEERALQYEKDGVPKQAKLQRDFRDAKLKKAAEYESALSEAQRDIAGAEGRVRELNAQKPAEPADVDAARLEEVDRLQRDNVDLQARAENLRRSVEENRANADRAEQRAKLHEESGDAVSATRERGVRDAYLKRASNLERNLGEIERDAAGVQERLSQLGQKPTASDASTSLSITEQSRALRNDAQALRSQASRIQRQYGGSLARFRLAAGRAVQSAGELRFDTDSFVKQTLPSWVKSAWTRGTTGLGYVRDLIKKGVPRAQAVEAVSRVEAQVDSDLATIERMKAENPDLAAFEDPAVVRAVAEIREFRSRLRQARSEAESLPETARAAPEPASLENGLSSSPGELLVRDSTGAVKSYSANYIRAEAQYYRSLGEVKGQTIEQVVADYSRRNGVTLETVDGFPVREWFEQNTRAGVDFPVAQRALVDALLIASENEFLLRQASILRSQGLPVPEPGVPEVPVERVAALEPLAQAAPRGPSPASLFQQPFVEGGRTLGTIRDLDFVRNSLDEAARRGTPFETVAQTFPDALRQSKQFVEKAKQYYDSAVPGTLQPTLLGSVRNFLDRNREARQAQAQVDATRLDARRVLSESPEVIDGVSPTTLGVIRSSLDTYLRDGERGADWSTAQAALKPLRDANVVADASLRRWFSSREFMRQAETVYKQRQAQRFNEVVDQRYQEAARETALDAAQARQRGALLARAKSDARAREAVFREDLVGADGKVRANVDQLTDLRLRLLDSARRKVSWAEVKDSVIPEILRKNDAFVNKVREYYFGLTDAQLGSPTIRLTPDMLPPELQIQLGIRQQRVGWFQQRANAFNQFQQSVRTGWNGMLDQATEYLNRPSPARAQEAYDLATREDVVSAQGELVRSGENLQADLDADVPPAEVAPVLQLEQQTFDEVFTPLVVPRVRATEGTLPQAAVVEGPGEVFKRSLEDDGAIDLLDEEFIAMQPDVEGRVKDLETLKENVEPDSPLYEAVEIDLEIDTAKAELFAKFKDGRISDDAFAYEASQLEGRLRQELEAQGHDEVLIGQELADFNEQVSELVEARNQVPDLLSEGAYESQFSAAQREMQREMQDPSLSDEDMSFEISKQSARFDLMRDHVDPGVNGEGTSKANVFFSGTIRPTFAKIQQQWAAQVAPELSASEVE